MFPDPPDKPPAERFADCILDHHYVVLADPVNPNAWITSEDAVALEDKR